MKISLFNTFGARNSVPVFEAIAQGLVRQGHSVSYHDPTADAAVIWSMLWAGRMRPNQEVYELFRHQGKPVIVAEVGMIQRGQTWKIGINGTGVKNYNFDQLIPDRARNIGLKLQPWKSGNNIVIAMQRHDSYQWSGQPEPQTWLSNVVKEIKKYSDRTIVVRPHPRGICPVISDCVIDTPKLTIGTYDDFDFDRTLANAHCVLNWNSGPGPQAIVAGIPAFVGPDSLASSIADWDLSKIENPPLPDRELWINQLAHTEWTINEIATGEPVARLLRLQSS